MEERLTGGAMRLPNPRHALLIAVGLFGIGLPSASGQTSLRLITEPEPATATLADDLAAAYEGLGVGFGDYAHQSGELGQFVGDSGQYSSRVIQFSDAQRFQQASEAVDALPASAAASQDVNDAELYSYRIVAMSEAENSAKPAGAVNADLYKLLFVAVRHDDRPSEAQSGVPKRVEGDDAPITPIASKPLVATAPQPLDLNYYPMPAAIHGETATAQPIAKQVAGGPGGEAENLEPVSILPPRSEESRGGADSSRFSSSPHPSHQAREVMQRGLTSDHKDAPVATPPAEIKTIALAARKRQPLTSVPDRVSLGEEFILPSEGGPGPTAQGRYLGDAISAGLTPCVDGECLPQGCPYYLHQSGTPYICGVDCGPYGAACCESWADSRMIPWSLFGPGEYVGPPRPEHVPAYYLRVNDLLTLTFIASRQKQPDRYRIGVGDRLRIESRFDESIDREVEVQPDGEISLPLVGDVPAAGRTIEELREELTRRYGAIEREPHITVSTLEVNAAMREIIKAVTSQSRTSGQALDLRVTPEGTIQAPGLGSVYVQGLTLEELRSELEARYTAMYGAGLLVSPALTARATSFVFVGGEVASPGRYTLEGPTTVMQAIALAGGWNNGGNLRQVVVFRRDENWCLKATKIDIHHPLYGKDPCPVNDVWLRDNDLVIVPKTKILCAADIIELYFTRGVYAVFPITFVKDLSRGSTMAVPVGP